MIDHKMVLIIWSLHPSFSLGGYNCAPQESTAKNQEADNQRNYSRCFHALHLLFVSFRSIIHSGAAFTAFEQHENNTK